VVLPRMRRIVQHLEVTLQFLQKQAQEGEGGSEEGGVPLGDKEVRDKRGLSKIFPAKEVDCWSFAQAPAGGEGPHPPAPGEHEEGRRLILVTALPPSLWREHLSPWLSIPEAAGLRVLCKAMKALVREWPVHMDDHLFGGSVIDSPEKLEAALTCFPAIESLTITLDEPLAPAEESELVELLRGHGGRLKRVNVEGGGAKRLLSSAVRAGALPSLTRFKFALEDPVHREILSGGVLPLLERVSVKAITQHRGETAAALEPLRRLKHLRFLSLFWYHVRDAALSPFIPPSLKTLSLSVEPVGLLEKLLPNLSSELQASGARLEAFIFCGIESMCSEGGDALAQVLRKCSSTLKTLKLEDGYGPLTSYFTWVPDFAPALVSCCATLEVLHCPWEVFSALPASCPTFPRLTELELQRARLAVGLESPAWDIMINGRLPALTSLEVVFSDGLVWGEGKRRGEGGSRMTRAFEAVAGTLRRLNVRVYFRCHQNDVPAGACHELGLAIGKLRRLRHLDIHELLTDGRNYRAVAEGVAASGGCPELFEVIVDGLAKNFEWFVIKPSLVAPSVRNLDITGRFTKEEALSLCCALLEADYEHGLSITMVDPDDEPLPAAVVACMSAILGERGMSAHIDSRARLIK
jgi:hypothetical protein